MDDVLAQASLREVIAAIDKYGRQYDQMWDSDRPVPLSLSHALAASEDEVRGRVRFARDLIDAMNEPALAKGAAEHPEGAYGGHPFQQARKAIVEAAAILAQREELAAIVGPRGPQLAASELHHGIWSVAADLWDGGHVRQAVQTAASALEGMLQAIAGPSLGGEGLAILFSTKPPEPSAPRLRLRDLDQESKTWTSAHEGAAALVRGAFMAVRNLVLSSWVARSHAQRRA